MLDRIPCEQLSEHLEAFAQHATPRGSIDGVAKRRELARAVVANTQSQHETSVRQQVQRYRLASEHRRSTPYERCHHGTKLNGRGRRSDSGKAYIRIENVSHAGSVEEVIPQKKSVPAGCFGRLR